jgi:hypothetical protein
MFKKEEELEKLLLKGTSVDELKDRICLQSKCKTLCFHSFSLHADCTAADMEGDISHEEL